MHLIVLIFSLYLFIIDMCVMLLLFYYFQKGLSECIMRVFAGDTFWDAFVVKQNPKLT